MTSPISRWVPAAGAVVVVAAAAIAIPMTATASSALPAKTPEQVLQLVAKSHVTAFSGTVEQTSSLGLPSLPSGGSADADSGLASSLALLTGNHSIRIYVDGARKQRVQLLDSMAERDLIRNGTSVWAYDSKANTAKHSTLTTPKRVGERKAHLGAIKQGQLPSNVKGATSTPAEIATKLLAALRPTSRVTVGPDVTIANRPAYNLVLSPKARGTLIGSVSIAVDAATGMPLGVDVDARGQKTAAVSVHFGSLTLARPSASLFTFTPPSGAKVTEVKPSDAKSTPSNPSKPVKPSTRPTVTGKGWNAVVTIPSQSKLNQLEASKQFGLMTSTVSGGRLLHTSLVNVLFTTDGRVVVGSVSAARLEAVASAQ